MQKVIGLQLDEADEWLTMSEKDLYGSDRKEMYNIGIRDAQDLQNILAYYKIGTEDACHDAAEIARRVVGNQVDERHPALGEVTLEIFINAIYGHQLMHMRDLQRLLA